MNEDLKIYEELVEKTGHSYSGISDVMHNGEVKDKHVLLEAIDDWFQAVVKRQAELEQELEGMIELRRMLVRDFCHCHNALRLGEKPLAFMRKDGILTEVVVKDYEQAVIEYERHVVTV